MDRSLVERAQSGDRDAYEALARQAAGRLYRVAYRIVRDSDHADDAVQQALVAIWRELPSLRDPDRFEAWTYRLVVRFCLSDRRRAKRVGATIVAIRTAASSTDGGTDAVNLRDELERALRTLSVEQRTVVVLHHYAGLPLTEIADVLGVPYGTVGSRHHHALRALRSAVQADARPAIAGGHPA